MARYSTQPIKKTINGKRTLTTTRYPKIPNRISDVYVVATDGDRLDILAHQFYGRVDYWWIIASANNVGKASLHITEGLQLRIPKETDAIIQEFNRLNNVT